MRSSEYGIISTENSWNEEAEGQSEIRQKV